MSRRLPSTRSEWFEIDTRVSTFGHVRHAARGDATCFAGVGEESPCALCPVLLGVAVSTVPRATGCVIVETRHTGRNRAFVRETVVPADTLRILLRSRVEDLARRGKLSGRERGVLLELAAGLDNEEIATRLGISPRTVKFHVGSIFRKLRMPSRLALLRKLQEP